MPKWNGASDYIMFLHAGNYTYDRQLQFVDRLVWGVFKNHTWDRDQVQFHCRKPWALQTHVENSFFMNLAGPNPTLRRHTHFCRHITSSNPAEHGVSDEVVKAWQKAVSANSKAQKNAIFQAFLKAGKDWGKPLVFKKRYLVVSLAKGWYPPMKNYLWWARTTIMLAVYCLRCITLLRSTQRLNIMCTNSIGCLEVISTFHLPSISFHAVSTCFDLGWALMSPKTGLNVNVAVSDMETWLQIRKLMHRKRLCMCCILLHESTLKSTICPIET